MITRVEYMKAIRESLEIDGVQDYNAAIQALLAIAAATCNGLSNNNIGLAQHHIHEAMQRMLAVLQDTFDLEPGDERTEPR